MITLAGDIGGTHARLALVESTPTRRIVERHDYDSRDYPGLEPIVRDFLSRTGAEPSRACLGVACHILGGVCEMSNLPWTITVDRFGDKVGLPGLRFINDFSAVGWAISELTADDVVTLRAGRPELHLPIGTMGPGTGLGAGFLTWDGARYRVHASEGGHTDFAPRTPLEVELFTYLAARFPRVSYERVVSGPGLVNVYQFLVATGHAKESPAVRHAMDTPDGDPGRAISRSALAGEDKVCIQALDIFASVFGAAAGNLAITLNATGGIYLAGGIAPAILDKLRDGTFERAFLSKGRATDVVDATPVHVIVRDGVGLLGAAVAAEVLASTVATD